MSIHPKDCYKFAKQDATTVSPETLEEARKLVAALLSSKDHAAILTITIQTITLDDDGDVRNQPSIVTGSTDAIQKYNETPIIGFLNKQEKRTHFAIAMGLV